MFGSGFRAIFDINVHILLKLDVQSQHIIYSLPSKGNQKEKCVNFRILDDGYCVVVLIEHANYTELVPVHLGHVISVSFGGRKAPGSKYTQTGNFQSEHILACCSEKNNPGNLSSIFSIRANVLELLAQY